MEKLVHFFSHIQSWQRTLALALGIAFFWIWEWAFPLFRFRYRKIRHAGLNFLFTLTTVLINFIFAFLIVAVSDLVVQHHIGLLQWISLPLWLFILAGLMVLDFISAWLIHWIEHRQPWMWRFHLIHHADRWVDSTTALRHHPVESIFRAVFTLLAVVVAGAPVWLILFYQFLSVLLSQFNHANIALPAGLDRLLSWFIVSPNMHKVHHHYAQPLTDMNYGNIFSCWDRLAGTFMDAGRAGELRYGIDRDMPEQDQDSAGKLLRFPFRWQRKNPAD